MLRDCFKVRSSLFWDVTQRTLVVTDVSGHPTGPVGPNLEEGTERLPRNVGNYHAMLHNIPEERRSHLHGGGRLKSYLKVSVRMAKVDCNHSAVQ
jgi:hypothetical protein